MNSILASIITFVIILFAITADLIADLVDNMWKKVVNKRSKSINGGNDWSSQNVWNDDVYRRLLSKSLQSGDQPPMITYDDIDVELQYRKNASPLRPDNHIGQRKLFLNELLTLCKFQEITKDTLEDKIIVYAGGAPSNHIYYLHELFPALKILIVDPNEVHIYKSAVYDNTNAHNLKITTHYDSPSDVVYFRPGRYDMYYKFAGRKHTAADYPKPIRVYDFATGDIIETFKTTPEANILGRSWNPIEHTKTMFEVMKESSDHIFIIEDYFTIELANAMAEFGNKIIFFSDIRTNLSQEFNYSNDSTGANVPSLPTDLDILWNLSQQFNWLSIIKPRLSMWKFRCPFNDSLETIDAHASTPMIAADLNISKKYGIDFIADNKQGYLSYPPGVIYIQPFAGVSSTESRLVIKSEDIDKRVKYRNSEYENKFYAYNNIYRCFVPHINNISDKLVKYGVDKCNDCAMERYIWDCYKTNFAPELDIDDAIIKLCAHTARKLNRNSHGEFTDFTLDWYLKVTKERLAHEHERGAASIHHNRTRPLKLDNQTIENIKSVIESNNAHLAT